ncbi:ABC transporter ATP-binding protein [Lutispora thermophila]|uniref:Iron complex transport system ATP-binding protein n=1 Tax=Lutispora thermophila DSM 19022 TaxID=1122184 RepID=A0A1M6H971_9FIRM|nr:ABC transporter ATP-binding protein [Lutispora thermophila]SHJ18780.1 iron complex transport system ATP-binding protein [Lutispora thermophila DSM 19022]
MKMLETRNLTVGYGNKEVVREMNIEVLKGQILCILGPNGSGKSTILKSLSKLLNPLKGDIYIKGEKLSDIKGTSLSKTLAVVLTERLNVGFLTSFDIVAMGRYPHTGILGRLTKSDEKKIWECLGMINGENIATRYYNELSDGEKQKVLLARALAQEPEIIILDEPTTHLDVKHKLEVMSILKKLSKEKGITVILSLHDIDIALKSCDRVMLVKKGAIVDFGFPEEVGSNKSISDLYDIKDAGFNAFLGTIELSNQSKPSVFVIGGGGHGVPIYRLLTKKGIGVNTGIIHKNDVDYEIAITMGLDIQSETPFSEIKDATLEKAKSMIDKVDTVIDSGCPLGNINRKNIELLAYALESGKKVLSIRDKDELQRCLAMNYLNLKLCDSVSEIMDNLDIGGEGSKW